MAVESNGGLLTNTYTWTAVALAVVFFLVWWKGRSSIKDGLQSRIDRIKSELDEAERLKEEAVAMLADYRRKQDEAIKTAEDIVAQAKLDVEHMREEASQRLEEMLERREQQAMDRIAQAEAAALREVRGSAVDMAIAASRAVLADKLSGKEGDALVDGAIEDLAKRLH